MDDIPKPNHHSKKHATQPTAKPGRAYKENKYTEEGILNQPKQDQKKNEEEDKEPKKIMPATKSSMGLDLETPKEDDIKALRQ